MYLKNIVKKQQRQIFSFLDVSQNYANLFPRKFKVKKVLKRPSGSSNLNEIYKPNFSRDPYFFTHVLNN